MRKHLLFIVMLIIVVILTACSSGSSTGASETSGVNQVGGPTLTPFQPNEGESSAASPTDQDQALIALLLGKTVVPEGFDSCVSAKIGPDRLEALRLGEAQVGESDLVQAQACLQLVEIETQPTDESATVDLKDVEVPVNLQPANPQNDNLQPPGPKVDSLQPSRPKDDNLEPPGTAEEL